MTEKILTERIKEKSHECYVKKSLSIQSIRWNVYEKQKNYEIKMMIEKKVRRSFHCISVRRSNAFQLMIIAILELDSLLRHWS